MKTISRLKYYEELGIGLERKEVFLKPFNPSWKIIFKEEAELIQATLKIQDLTLHHVGSTSVPKLSAKPIIDILLVVRSLDDLDRNNELLENLGYEYKGEYGIVGRRYCVLYNSDKTKGLVHLHAFQEDSKEIEDHLLFRDYLCLHDAARLEYEDHKRDLIERKKVARSDYSDHKTEVIQKLLYQARSFFKGHPMVNEMYQIEELPFKRGLGIASECKTLKLSSVMQDSFSKIEKHCQENRITPSSEPFAFYEHVNWEELTSMSHFKMFIKMINYKWIFHCAYPMEHAVLETSEIRLRDYEFSRCVSMIHIGHYRKVGESYSKLYKWMKQQGLKAQTCSFESYLNDPRVTEVKDWKTKIYIPLK